MLISNVGMRSALRPSVRSYRHFAGFLAYDMVYTEKSSDDIFFDDFGSGAFDVSEITDLAGADRDVMVASAYAHVLAERSNDQDYRSIAKKNDLIPAEYYPAHLKACAFESADVSDY